MIRSRTFFSYVIPSVLAFALSGIYTIVDGLFIGNSIGDAGLSAINIVYPVVALIQAIGTGIGMGGAVAYSVSNATQNQETADLYAGGTGTLLLIASALVTSLLYLTLDPLLRLLGAEGNLFSLGRNYLRIIILGAVFQIFATGIVPLIRNYGGALFAMVSMAAGFLTNIALDYIFVWSLELGIFGAAIATIIGQGVTMMAGFIYLYQKKRPILCFRVPQANDFVCRVMRVGLAPFGLTLTPNLSVILMNRFTIFYGGECAVACYACISYALAIVYALLQGVGDGSQPLMSRYYGVGNAVEFRHVRQLSYGLAELLAFISAGILVAGRFEIGRLFGASEEVLIETGHIFPIFLLGIIFLAFTRVTTSGFYATEKSVFSYILVYAEPIILLLLLLILPQFADLTGVWWCTCLSQMVCAVIALFLKNNSDKQGTANRRTNEFNSRWNEGRAE